MFLRMVARPLMAKVNQTTGVKKVPEEVVPNAREILIGLHSQILNQIKKVPEYLTYRQHVEKHSSYMLKIFKADVDMGSIPSRVFTCPSQVVARIEEARVELKQISDLVAEWHSCRIQPLSQTTEFVGRLYEKPNARTVLIWLYNEALNVLRKVPGNKQYNYLRMYAQNSIAHKLQVCQEEYDWESIKSKLGCEDPIQKAQDELDHWTLFFGSDTRPRPFRQ